MAFLRIAIVIGFATLIAGSALAGAREREVVKPASDFTRPEKYELMSAGAATSKKRVNRDAFSHSSTNLALDQEMRFKLGNALFRKLWVSAPASTGSSDGLGPLFNARSCQRCHLKDGRGHPPPAGTVKYDLPAMLMRFSVPPKTEAARQDIKEGRRAFVPHPIYGAQLQDFAIQGHTPEGKMLITYEETPVTLADGAVVMLRKPDFRIEKLGYGPLGDDVMMSPRVAPPMIGLGLLEMVDPADIERRADPDDADGDGISGRMRRTWDIEKDAAAIGRFGWKAGTPSIRQQTAEAFRGDVGISTSIMPDDSGECTAAEEACRAAPGGGSKKDGGVEAGADVLELVTHYARHLAVPARRKVDDPKVLRGKQVFYESGCASCHVPKFVTRREPDRPAQSHQLIWPYTDLLLHDMGPGLADDRPEGNADGREWRTQPLWGIGLTETVSGHTLFLHDGRARSLLEAVLWHGGEAEAAKQRVVELQKQNRDALIAFLESL